MIAAGCAGTGARARGLVDLRKVGARREPDDHRSSPRRARRRPAWPSRRRASCGRPALQNPGIDAFIAEELPRLAKSSPHVVVSIAGGSLEEYVRLTGRAAGASRGLGDRGLPVGARSRARARDARERTSTGRPRSPARWPACRWCRSSRSCRCTPRSCRRSPAVVRAGVTGVTIGGSPRGARRAVRAAATGPRRRHRVAERARAAADDPAGRLRRRPRGARRAGDRRGRHPVRARMRSRPSSPGRGRCRSARRRLIDPSAPVTVAQGIVRYLKAKGLASPADVRGRLRVPASFRRWPTRA